MMKALFSIIDLQNRVETNTFSVFDYDVVLALRYLLFFFIAKLYKRLHKILRCLLNMDGQSQLQYSDNLSKGGLLEMERKDKCDGLLTLRQLNDTNSQSQEICYCQRYQSICLFTQFVFNIKLFSN